MYRSAFFFTVHKQTNKQNKTKQTNKQTNKQTLFIISVSLIHTSGELAETYFEQLDELIPWPDMLSDLCVAMIQDCGISNTMHALRILRAAREIAGEMKTD